MHIGPDGNQQEVTEPNTYSGFPIEDDLRLSCTLIVKLHGAIGQRQLSSSDGRDYVISEDNYIDYLSGRAVEQIVPMQILQKLKKSHCVFLGYDIADWSLRVLLKRVWGSEFESSSWAVHPDAEEFESRLWRKFGLEVIPDPLEAFAAELEAALRHE
jgi:SIR2-like domain